MTLAAGDSCDVEWFHLAVDAVVHFTDVFDEGPVLKMARSVYAKLSLQVVSARVGKLMGDFACTVLNLAHGHCMFLAGSCINNKLICKFATHSRGLKNSMARVISVCVVINIGQLHHIVIAPTEKNAVFRDR